MAKFHFLVPLMPRVMVQDNWSGKLNSVETTFTLCLQSLLRQSYDGVQVNVASHDDLPIADTELLANSRLKHHRVTFSTPKTIELDEYNELSGKILPALPDITRRKVNDKYSKIKVCLTEALKDPECEYVMLVDADDMVNRNLASYVMTSNQPDCGGYTVTKGYSHVLGTNELRLLDAFHKTCGSCNINRITVQDRELFNTHGNVNAFDRKTHWLFAGHASVFERIRQAGKVTFPLPFRAVIYVVNNGSNISKVTSVGGTRETIGSDITEQFGLKSQ